MTSDEAHARACHAFATNDSVGKLLAVHGNELYSSLRPPSDQTGGQWLELVLLGTGEAKYIDDPTGSSVVVARCYVDPATGKCRVEVNRGMYLTSADPPPPNPDPTSEAD